MKITHEARGFAAKQNAPLENNIAVEEAEKGMAEMSERYCADGDLYVPSDRRR